jgi:hypothetical protein
MYSKIIHITLFTKFMHFLPILAISPWIPLNLILVKLTVPTPLSIWVSEYSLTQKEHIDCIQSKPNSLSYMVCSLRPVLEFKILKQLYFSS